MRTKRRSVNISQFLLRISYIEVQGRRANDIKHSASWEATQVFIALFLSLSVFFLMFVFGDIGLLVLSVIGIFSSLFTFRTRERRYWGGSVYVEHYKSRE